MSNMGNKSIVLVRLDMTLGIEGCDKNGTRHTWTSTVGSWAELRKPTTKQEPHYPAWNT